MVVSLISAESETIRRAACLCLALTCFQQESKAEAVINLLETYSVDNPSQFGQTSVEYAGLAVGLAYFRTGNVQQCQRLLLLSNRLNKTFGAKLTIEALGLVLKPSTQAL